MELARFGNSSDSITDFGSAGFALSQLRDDAQARLALLSPGGRIVRREGRAVAMVEAAEVGLPVSTS